MTPQEWFLQPQAAIHRQYEALRAVFVDDQPYKEVAKRFGYKTSTMQVMCSRFRNDPERQFFLEPRRGRKPKTNNGDDDPMVRMIIHLRKQNLSVYDIASRLKADGRSLSEPHIGRILKEQGFAKLPRRRDDERPATPVDAAPVADVSELDLSNRSFDTKFGGIFLFLPLLARIEADRLFTSNNLPGSPMIPPPQAVLALLALKLFGSARHSHVISDVFDQGLGLFAGLNVTPKASFLSQYSCRVDPDCHPALLQSWFSAISALGYTHGTSFDLDFHCIPTHGADPMLQKHYHSKRSRRQKGILSFIASDDQNRAFCYVNTDLRRETQNDEILIFVERWREQTGEYPQELVFDSTFTTYENLDTLNRMGIDFITLRRRTSGVLDEINKQPSSAWRRIKLENVARAYRTPRVFESQVTLKDYQGSMRQFAIRDLGHEYPTLLITNQQKRSAAKLIQRYARRMLIENNIADAVEFFHMDALSSTVPLKVDFDLVTTVMASTLYRLLAAQIGNGYSAAKFSTIFRHFVAATAKVEIEDDIITVRYQKRAHNPMLMAAGLDKPTTAIPWLENKNLKLIFG